MPAPEPRRVEVAYVEVAARTALNQVQGMPFKWSLNPYTGCEHRCAFCYVRGFELRADRAAGDGYGRSVRVKINLPQVLRQEFSRRSWRKEGVVIGTATDPYQPAEGRYRITRRCLEAFRDFSNSAEIITRGPMIVRDIDLLRELAQRAEVVVNFSVPTLDEEVWRRTEPGTAHPRQRLRAMGRLVEAGIRAGVAMAPILPNLSDGPEQLEEVVKAAREAGATHLWSAPLNLRPGTREHFLEVLGRHWPELLPQYRGWYEGPGYLPSAASRPTSEVVGRLRSKHRIGDRRRVRLSPAPAPQQMTLLSA